MPYKQVTVSAEKLGTIEINGLYIEVFHTYNHGAFDQRKDYRFTLFYLPEDDESGAEFDILPLANNLGFLLPSLYREPQEFQKTCLEIIRQALLQGKMSNDMLPEFIQEHLADAVAGKYEPEILPGSCPKCGCHHFVAHQVCRLDVIVDSNNNWQENLECYDSERPYGPYTCTLCGAEYSNLPNGSGIDG